MGGAEREEAATGPRPTGFRIDDDDGPGVRGAEQPRGGLVLD